MLSLRSKYSTCDLMYNVTDCAWAAKLRYASNKVSVSARCPISQSVFYYDNES